jgi:hypothetical protein
MSTFLKREEKQELRRIGRGQQTNELLRHDTVSVQSLIRKGLLEPSGSSIVLTAKGTEALRHPPLEDTIDGYV